MEYNPSAGDVGPLAHWRVVPETATGPAVFLGTSSDRIGTPRGRAYYVTVGKSLERETGLPISPYVSVLYSEWDRGFRTPFGASIRLAEQWSTMLTYDGHAFHPLLTYTQGQYSFTGILVRGRHPGISIGRGF